ncbi:MAG TPA: MraY family glycosyltransferase [Candidatus Acidoferrum sp.]|nr:MraY family glycosyltransferase [Candidatus Acidoferrum sp.]
MRSLAKRKNLLDRPGDLKPHQQPTPRIGGAAMAIGLAAGVLIAVPEMRGHDWIGIVAVLAIWFVGLADDLWNLTPSVRLASELLGGAVLWLAGFQTDWFKTPVLDLAATCVLFALLINAMNMLDGADGLAAGVAAVGAIGFIIAPGGSYAAIVFAGCLIAVCAATLIYNFPPASIFMGDSGSTLVGALIGLLILQRRSGAAGFVGTLPLLAFFLLPVGDAGLAIVRRLRSRHSPFHGDRRHYYDLLLRRGWPVRAVLGVSYGLTVILTCAGLLCESGRVSGFVLMGALAVALVVFAGILGSFTPDQQVAKPPQGAKLLPKIEA